MKNLIFLILISAALPASAQVISRESICSGSGYFEQATFTLSASLGEFSGFGYYENECLSIETGTEHADEFIPCFGDFDYNQEVNVADLLLLNANYGLTGLCIDGDLDQNQQVKVSDVLIFFGAYGQVCE
ncbi:MAG: hypothetical protein SGI87_09825 [Flavobacteriales bacterium]|nr:hypothetical protein [Flavobacteriales bacterium]